MNRNKVRNKQFFAIGCLFLAVAVVVVLLGLHVRDVIVKSSALNYAEQHAKTVIEARNQYIINVILPLKLEASKELIAEAKGRPLLGLPYPADFSANIGEGTSQKEATTDNVEMYSRFPFINRANQNYVRSEFSDAALLHFTEAIAELEVSDNDSQLTAENRLTEILKLPAYYKFEGRGPSLALKYAVPDVTIKECMHCHYSKDPSNPTSDVQWGLGDLRGILEIRLPLNKLLSTSLRELNQAFVIYLVVLLMGAGFIIKMLRDLMTKNDALEVDANSLVEEIRTRKQAELMANQSRLEAEEANVAKTAFLSTMSHELRTPMNAIIGFTDVLLRNYQYAEKQTDLLSRVSRASKSLLTLINELLDLSKIEAGKLDLEHVNFNLENELDDIKNLLIHQAEVKGIGLTLSYPVLPETFVGDPARLRQVLINIIGNAIKFTQEGGVEVHANMSASFNDRAIMRFQVDDTGVGMGEDQCERIFKPFMQADSTTSRKFGGTGLGLSISQKLIEMMGGIIQVESEFGRGSRFSFEIDLEIAQGVEPAASGDDLHDDLHDELLFSGGFTPEQDRLGLADREFEIVEDELAPSSTSAFQGQLKILLADQKPEDQQLLTSLLDELGYPYVSVSTGAEIITKVNQSLVEGDGYDLILVGINLPEKDGFELTAYLRELEATKHVAIVGLTDKKSIPLAENCLVSGMNEYIVAPYNFNQLEKLLLRWSRKLGALH